MRKAAMLALFALLALVPVLAQNPANANNSQSSVPQQNSNTSNPNPNQSATLPASQNSTPPASQTTAPPSTGQGIAQPPAISGGREVPAGKEIRATLDTPLSTRTSKPGDRFTATVSQSLEGTNGAVIPAGTRIEGEVAEADEGKTMPALHGRGKLNLRFRDMVLPNGQTIPLTATLVSVNNTRGKSMRTADNEGQGQSGTQGKDVAKDVGRGAGVGTVGGFIFGAPLKGLAVGTLAGGGYVLATSSKQVNLPAETGMVLRLDQPINMQ